MCILVFQLRAVLEGLLAGLTVAVGVTSIKNSINLKKMDWAFFWHTLPHNRKKIARSIVLFGLRFTYCPFVTKRRPTTSRAEKIHHV